MMQLHVLFIMYCVVQIFHSEWTVPPITPSSCCPPHENNCTIINPTAPYKLHPVTTASIGELEGKEMADKLLDLSTGVDMAGGARMSDNCIAMFVDSSLD